MTDHFLKFRQNIIGIDCEFVTPYNERKRLVYADWTASGRNYLPIERKLIEEAMPFVANTHTETNTTGKTMTLAYHESQHIIKKHVNASPEDVLISSNSGMTGVVNKFQRILGLKVHESYKEMIELGENDRPIVFITHMEHHSNQTSWLETLADVRIIEPTEDGLVDLKSLERLLEEYKHRKTKYAAITSCSNVTGIFAPYHEIAKLMHRAGGFCFVDFACSAPYINIDMHPNEDPEAYLDAIYFSPHKFLGGPGATGILVFSKKLYHLTVPDTPGGGTVEWTNPWGGHRYVEDIEAREDGGTPAFLQTIRTALAIVLKEQMGVENILKREEELLDIIWEKMANLPNLHILADEHRHRLGVISFYIDGLHYNMGVKLLNDRFGIQVRGGCSCAGTYGHYLLKVDQCYSKEITDMIDSGDYSRKPGWIRMSIHPTMTNEEVEYVCNCIVAMAKHFEEWLGDYEVNAAQNDIHLKKGNAPDFAKAQAEKIFAL